MRLDLKGFYSTVLSQTISECGRFLFIGNNIGDVFLLSLLNFNNHQGGDEETLSHHPVTPLIILSLRMKAINSLAFHNATLIIGTNGVAAYMWGGEKLGLTQKTWEVKVASAEASQTEVNSLLRDSSSDTIFAGCDNNIIYQVDLNDGKVMRTFKGHNDYIHCLSSLEKSIYSASEDGTVQFWDIREKKPVDYLEPCKHPDLSRPQFGNWQGTVSVTKDWLLCGGGPKASIWHLRSRECAVAFPFTEKVHCSAFLDDIIIVAGESVLLHQYTYNAKTIAEVPISGPAAYSIAYQNSPVKFLAAGGASNYLDIYTNLSYRDFLLKLYDN